MYSWSWRFLLVDINHMAIAFRHLTIGWSWVWWQSLKLITVEGLLLSRIVFAHWGISLHLSWTFQYIAIFVNVFHVHITSLRLWSWRFLLVDINHMAIAFRHLTIGWSWVWWQSLKLITVEGLLLSRIVFAHWGISLHLSWTFQYIAIFVNVFHVHITSLRLWSWRFLLVDINHMAIAFRHLTIGWSWVWWQSLKLITVEGLLLSRIVFAHWGISLHLSWTFQYIAIFVNVFHVHITSFWCWSWIFCCVRISSN